jgi:hypothetical protein
MIGYCKDGQYMALVYEYMSEGTLQEQIAGMPYAVKSSAFAQHTEYFRLPIFQYCSLYGHF